MCLSLSLVRILLKDLKLQKQVCVQLPTSAVSVTLPTFAAERRPAAPLLLSACTVYYGACCTARLLQARRAAIDRYLLPAERSAANLPHTAAARSIDGTDGHIQTDARPFHRLCSAYYTCGQCQ